MDISQPDGPKQDFPTTNSHTRFGFLRHGETEWNIKKKIQGKSDSPLTKNGRSQMSEWAHTLQHQQWQMIIASNLGRARQSARLINKILQLPLDFDSRLQEQNWGIWESQTLAAIKKNNAFFLQEQIERGWNFSAPEGEKRVSVKKRIFQCLEEYHRKYPGKNILVLCHQGVIQCTFFHLLGLHFLPEEKEIVDPRCLHIAYATEGDFFIEKLNIPRNTDYKTSIITAK